MSDAAESYRVQETDSDNDGHLPADCGNAAVDLAGPGLLLHTLARVPERTILDETRLAHLLHVNPRTVRRMVSRFELPPPILLGGRSIWMAGRILDHIGTAIDRKQKTAERQAKHFRDLQEQ
jgi:hypothetical protein